jgi:LuxR family quorum sensing-dependent transcriptional regulator
LPLIQETYATLESFASLSDPEAILKLLAETLSPFGFTAFVLTRLPRPPQRVEPSILLNGWPEGWSARYAEANHYPHDPVARHCLASTEPFAWTEIPPRLWLGARAQRIANEAGAFGLNEGLCVPLHTRIGAGGLSMAGPAIQATPDVRRMAAVLACYACAAAERAPPPALPEPGLLTEREREVLRWVAIGKKAHEIAAILRISDHTVGEHLKHIRRKLSAANAVHAVVEALRRGEIRL